MKRSVGARARVVVVVLLAAVVLAVYWPVVHHDFNGYDDVKYVTRNARVKEGLTAGGLGWAFTSFHASNWHPLTWISHMLDWEIYGPAAGGHHFTSVLLHLLNTCLLFLLLDLATGATRRSAAVAALFAVHPLHVESVAWIAERKDVLSTLFWMLAALAYVRSVRSRGTGKSLAVAVLFALGLMAKPMLVTLPFALLLLDAWPLGRWTWDGSATALLKIPRGLLVEKLPLFILSAASCAVTVAAQRGAIGSLERFPMAARIGNAMVSYVAYLGKTFRPADLAVFYPWGGGSAAWWKPALAALLLAIATAAAIRLRRGRPYLLSGWLWYLGTLVPVIGLLQVGKQSMADRYTYVPLIGIFVIAVWGAADALGALAGRRGGVRADARPGDSDPRWLLIPAMAVVLPLTVATRLELRHWRDAVSLFERSVSVAESDDAHTNLGEALMNRGRDDEAEGHFRAALRLNPSLPDAHNSLGFILEKKGRTDEARQEYEEAARLRPSYAAAHRNLGRLLVATGRFDEAIEHGERAVALGPDNAEAHANLGRALSARGRYGDAVPHFEAALRIEPGSPESHNNLGSALSELGRRDEAFAHFTEAIRLRPGYPTAHYNLATALYFRGRFAEAWDEVRAARKLGFSPPRQFLEMLAAKMPEPPPR